MRPPLDKTEVLPLDPGGDWDQMALGTASSHWNAGLADASGIRHIWKSDY